MNVGNWEQFLQADGTPSSKLIVEGANIFTTPEARELLHSRAGVSIVKDSSANKCGVITSSCEIQASMLLSKEEFMENKPELVHDVLERLRYLARVEGELMFREYANYPGNLPHFSERISNAINKTTDAITELLANVEPEDDLFKELLPVIKANLPKKLGELGGDRISERYPVQYQRNAIASGIAARLVYQEGVNLIEGQPQERLGDRAIEYYVSGRKLQAVLDKLENQHFGDNAKIKPQVLDILRKGGARTMVDGF
jgi:glutamate dehydrogenase